MYGCMLTRHALLGHPCAGARARCLWARWVDGWSQQNGRSGTTKPGVHMNVYSSPCSRVKARETTSLIHARRPVSGRLGGGCNAASSSSLEHFEAGRSRWCSCSRGGERRRLAGDCTARSAREATVKRDKRAIKRTTCPSLRRARSRKYLWCAALRRALRRCLAVCRGGSCSSVAERVDCC